MVLVFVRMAWRLKIAFGQPVSASRFAESLCSYWFAAMGSLDLSEAVTGIRGPGHGDGEAGLDAAPGFVGGGDGHDGGAGRAYRGQGKDIACIEGKHGHGVAGDADRVGQAFTGEIVVQVSDDDGTGGGGERLIGKRTNETRQAGDVFSGDHRSLDVLCRGGLAGLRGG